jgi:hypothetical protein
MAALHPRLLAAATLLAAALSPPMAPAAVPASDRAQVLQVVQRFFDALAANDVETSRALFLPGAQITAARNTPTGFALRRRTIEDDLQKMPANQNRYLERAWDSTVHLQGRLAAVWTPYDFHLNGKFSHSGIDAFTLVKTDEGWRIVSLAYSVEPETPSRHPAGPP